MRLVHIVLGALVSSAVYATPTPAAEAEAAAAPAALQPQKKCTTNTECIRMRELAARSKDLEDREAEAEAAAQPEPEYDLEERENDLRPRQSRRAVVAPRQSRRALVEPRQSRRAVVEPRQSRRALVEPRQSRRAIAPRQSRRAQPAKREIVEVEVPTHKKLTGHIIVYSASDLSTPLGVVVNNPNAAGRIMMQGLDQVRNDGRMMVTFDAKVEDVTADITLRVDDAPFVLTAERGAMNQSPVDQLSSGNWNYAFLTCGNSELSKDENQSTFVAETPRKTESALWTYNPTDSTLVPSWVNPDGTSTVASIVFAGESADVSDADRAIMLTGDVAAFDHHFAEQSTPLVFKLAIH